MGSNTGLIGGLVAAQYLDNPANIDALRLTHGLNHAKHTALAAAGRTLGLSRPLNERLSHIGSKAVLKALQFLPKTNVGRGAMAIGLPLASALGMRVPFRAAGGAIGQQFDAQPKQASLTEGIVGGIPNGVAGAGVGLGAGGLYGLLSGAYEAKKGKKLKGALGGLLRGAGGGALVGGGIGAGAGFGSGLMMPNVLTSNPIMQAIHASNLAMDPVGNLAKMTAGGIAGGYIGGRLGNHARKELMNSQPTDNKKDDADEGEDTNDDEQIKSKAAALAAVLAR